MASVPAHFKVIVASMALAACGVAVIVASAFRQEKPIPTTFVPAPVVYQPAVAPVAAVQTMTVYETGNLHRRWHEVPDDLIKYFPDDPQIGLRLRERLATFHISPQEAHEAAVAEQARRKELGLEFIRFGEKPVAVTDRCYIFAEFSWIGISLRGFYVDGNSGAVTWRENPDDVILYEPNDSDIRPRLNQRLASLKILPHEAFKIALEEIDRRVHLGQPTTAIEETPVALAGRRYVFGPARTFVRVHIVPEITLRGFYIDGDTGRLEWREEPPHQ